MAKKKLTVEEIDARTARWQSKLKRAVNTIERLQRMRKRIAKVATPKMTPAEQIAEPVLRKIAGQPAPSDPPAVLVPSIPDFLRRDKDAAEQIKQEQADAKKRKAQGREARKKAMRSGETKRMPLTGKAALDAIRNA